MTDEITLTLKEFYSDHQERIKILENRLNELYVYHEVRLITLEQKLNEIEKSRK